MLFSKQSINFNKTSFERRTDNRNTANDITDLNINERITKFQNQLKNEFVYRISLRYFSDIGKINFLLKIDFRIKCHIETDMKKLFELKKRVTTIGGPDAKSIFTKALFIQYEQFSLDKNFRQYLKTIEGFKKNLKDGSSKNTDTKNI